MAKSERKEQRPTLCIITLITLILIAGTFAYLYTQKLSAYSQLQLQLASNKTLLSATLAELNATKDKLVQISTKLNATEYNLTHPLIQTLYDKEIINVPPAEMYPSPDNTTYTYVPGQYNFSINVPYPGYINITETNTGLTNNATNGHFSIYVSQQKPIVDRNYTQPYLWFSSFYSPRTQTSPANGVTVTIPVLNGTTYIIFYNYNYNTGITVTFSIKYVGFRTH
jgi:hypothetical protein